MITVKARFDGRVFIPQEPVPLPAGCELEISLTPPSPAPSSAPPAAEQKPTLTAADLYGITGGNSNISEEEIEAVKYRPKWDGVRDVE